MSPKIALIAGEMSGDLLGAAIIRALRERLPDAEFYGVAGPRMTAAGCRAIASIDELSVMGVAEVVQELPRLLKLRRRIAAQLLQDRPALLIGIDAPDFNLAVETRLRAAGIKTAHVVSPTVWAWRAGRVKTIARAADALFCLFPFEPDFYARYGAEHGGELPRTYYIGHPLAEELDDSVTPAAARASLGLAEDGPLVAILPGSRGGELKYLAEPFVQAAQRIAQRVPGVRFVTPLAKPALRERMEQAIVHHAPIVPWTLLDGQSREAMRAADVVLLASGTATLECLLLGRPMVIAYRLSALTTWLLGRMGMLKTRHVGLPNLLTAEPVVPELLDTAAQPERLADEVVQLLQSGAARQRQLAQFDAVRQTLRQNAAARAAQAILELLDLPAA